MPTHLVALATVVAMISGGNAMAASITPPIQDLDLSGAVTWEVSDHALQTWNVLGLNPSALSPAAASFEGVPANFSSGAVQLPVSTITYDSTTAELQGLGLQGGYRLEAAFLGGLSWGGQIDITDLFINFKTGSVQGTITGVTALDEFVNYEGTIFTLGATTYDPAQWAEGRQNLAIAPLALDADASKAMARGLGDWGSGMDFIFTAAAENQGSLSIDLTPVLLDWPHPALTAPSVATAVPEPGSWLLMGAGMVGLTLISRRKHARSVH